MDDTTLSNRDVFAVGAELQGILSYPLLCDAPVMVLALHTDQSVDQLISAELLELRDLDARPVHVIRSSDAAFELDLLQGLNWIADTLANLTRPRTPKKLGSTRLALSSSLSDFAASSTTDVDFDSPL